MIFTSIESAKIEYVDGLLRSLQYHCYRLIELGETLDVLAIKLSGGMISSPRWLDREEAKYQRGTRIYHDNLLELIADEQEALFAYKDEEKTWYTIATFMQKLTMEEVEMLSMYYEYHYTYEQIGEKYGYSQWTIQRKIRKILLEF